MRKWGATGVGELRPEELPLEAQEHIRNQLKKSGIETADLKPLFSALKWILGAFENDRQLKQKSRPAKVRENLKTAHDTAQKLIKQLDDFDANSDLLVCEVGGVEYRNHAAELERWIDDALKLAALYPKGRLPEPERIDLAAHVAEAMHLYIGIKPTSYRDGPYCFLVGTMLELATDKPSENPHSLALDGLRKWKELKSAPDSAELLSLSDLPILTD